MKKCTKSSLMVLVMIILLTLPAIAFAGQSIKLIVNGQEIQQEVTPILMNDRTYFSVRILSNSLGITNDNILWKADEKMVTLLKGDRVVQVKIGSNIITVNGVNSIMDVSPEVINDKTMLPAVYIARAFGYTVNWDGDTQTVSITGTGNSPSTLTPIVNTTPLTTDELEKQEFIKIDKNVNDLFVYMDNLLAQDTISKSEITEMKSKLNNEGSILRAWPEIYYTSIKQMYVKALLSGNAVCVAKEFMSDSKYANSKDLLENIYQERLNTYENDKIDVQTEKIRLQKMGF